MRQRSTGWINRKAPARVMGRADPGEITAMPAVVNTGYSHHGANRTRTSMIGWNNTSASPDDDITLNVKDLQQRGRDLYMGNPLATGAIKTGRTNVVGIGLQLNPQIDARYLGLSADAAEAWELNTRREFALFADKKNCDAARMCDFYQLQQLAYVSAAMSGDVFALLPMIRRAGDVYYLKIQLIEADRICNPYELPEQPPIMEGVETGIYGEPLAYYVAKYHPLSLLNTKLNEWTKVPAFGERSGRRNMLHLMMDMERPGQRRGVTMLAPVIESLKQLGRYTDAEIMAAVVSGLFTAAITTDNGDAGAGFGEDAGAGMVSGSSIDDDLRGSIKLGNGTVIELSPGEKIESVNPGRPNTAFDGFVLSISRQIGAALEIPVELLNKHFTASYSASRAALLEAWKHFRRQRDWITTDFCQPIYEEWLTEAVARGRISAPGFFDDPAIRAAYCGAEWNGPSPGQIDPLKEVTAAILRVENGFSTRARETAELTGGDWNQNYRQRVREEQMMRDGGLVAEAKISVKSGEKEGDEQDAEDDKS